VAKLRLGAITDDKPVRLTVELPAGLHRDLLAYAEVIAHETGQGIAEPTKLIAAMLARFIATDRAFAKIRRVTQALDSARSSFKEVAKSSQRLNTVASDLGYRQHRHSQDSAWNTPHPEPKDE
jgi:hypothetical protein